MVLRTLTEEERDARAVALVEARRREEEERKQAEIDAKARVEREAREKIEREAAEARKREEELRHRRDDEVRRKAEDEAKRRLGDTASTETTRPRTTETTTPGAPARRLLAPSVARAPEEEEEAKRVSFAVRACRPRSSFRPSRSACAAGQEKNRGRLTVTTATGDDEERMRSVASFRRRVQRLKGHQQNEPKEKIAREVTIPETITIQELANRMAERAVDVIRLLMKQGAAGEDHRRDRRRQRPAHRRRVRPHRQARRRVRRGRRPVRYARDGRDHGVASAGRHDHGPCRPRQDLAAGRHPPDERGGRRGMAASPSTSAPTRSWRRTGGKITFIDTPGHAAFTAMRARGAKVTDIVVLVVAADDGVMPQTIEAINHAKAAKVPLIVAINKIDKPDAKPERVRTELLQYEVQVETMGGETLEVEVSATKKLNLDKLLEAINLQSELLDLKANPDRPAEGTVIEAKLDRGRGPVATVLVQRGTLRTGDIVVAGSEWGRVRALDVRCRRTGRRPPVRRSPSRSSASAARPKRATASPSSRTRPAPARSREYRSASSRDRIAARAGTARGSLADMMSQLKSAGRKEFPVLIKGDVQGSVEAIVGALDKIGTEEVMARVIHTGAGGINESDMTLAEASGAAILGFNVRANKEARDAAERTGIEIRYYNIIYDLVDDMKKAMSGLLAPTLREERLGEARILQVFAVSKVGKVAGCLVQDGRVERGQHCAAYPRQRRHPRRQALDAQALQGRGQGSRIRPGMRHGLRELPGHADRRHHRVLPRRGDPPLALSVASCRFSGRSVFAPVRIFGLPSFWALWPLNFPGVAPVQSRADGET